MIVPPKRPLPRAELVLPFVSFWFENVWLHSPGHMASAERLFFPPKLTLSVQVWVLSLRHRKYRRGLGQRARTGPQGVLAAGCHPPRVGPGVLICERFWKARGDAGLGFPLALTACGWRPSQGLLRPQEDVSFASSFVFPNSGDPSGNSLHKHRWREPMTRALF